MTYEMPLALFTRRSINLITVAAMCLILGLGAIGDWMWRNPKICFLLSLALFLSVVGAVVYAGWMS